MGNMIELSDLERTYRTGGGALTVLKHLDFTLPRGEWCCIFGASGSGKTTLLNLMGTLETPDAGHIVIDGCDVAKLNRADAARFRREKIGFIFQAYHLLPEFSVLENVALAGRMAGMSRHAAIQRATELLSRVQLDQRLDHRPSELSGGEQQRTAIARALMNRPKLLLADEPTGNLDEQTGLAILELLVDLRRNEPDLSIVMITHNLDLARFSDRVVTLSGGKLNEVPKEENHGL